MVGAYNIDNLPSDILYKISRGLTFAAKDGTIRPDVATKWKIGNHGKTYVFYLRNDIYFSDGTNLTSDLIRYNFANLSVMRPNKYTIVYSLKDSYSPFLLTVSKPIFKKGLIGISSYKIKDVKLNGNFVEYINLVSKKGKKISYQFYPTNSALKTAFSLGEVSKVVGLPDVKFRNTTFYSFKNARVEKEVDYQKLAALFYNNQDHVLSSKFLREALSYTIPDNFSQGIRNSGPFSPFSFASQETTDLYRQDIEHAKLLLDKAKSASEAASKISLTIDTLPWYESTANSIAGIWKKLGISFKVKVTTKIPSSFQVYLGEFNLSADPDQYTLWHSDQPSNITNYNNLRVDKLLEDGRKEIDIEKRKKIYAEFQKYILSDPPASFLFFPYTFDVTRKSL